MAEPATGRSWLAWWPPSSTGSSPWPGSPTCSSAWSPAGPRRMSSSGCYPGPGRPSGPRPPSMPECRDGQTTLPALPALLLALLLQACAWGGGNFVAPDRRPDLPALLPLPPAPGSPADRADLAALLAVQAARTPAAEAAARADAEETVFRLLGGMGIALDPAALPATASLFARIHADEGALVGPAKRRWHRPRPFTASPAVRPCVPRPWGASYPSGHAAFAYAAAEALADILPERREA